jgi:hypothetical protein
LIPHVNKVIQYLTVYACFISFKIMLSISIQALQMTKFH